MSQQCDEGVRHYLSRLKGVAASCEFNITCTYGVTNSFTETITRFKLIAGLDNKEIYMQQGDQHQILYRGV